MEFISWLAHWLLHEFVLTRQELKREITIPRIITGIVGYGLVHGGWSFINREKDHVAHRRKMALFHVKKRHDGRFSHCTECRITERHYLTQPPAPQ